LRQFRNHIHRGLADNITLRTARFGIRTAKPGCTDLSQRPPARCFYESTSALARSAIRSRILSRLFSTLVRVSIQGSNQLRNGLNPLRKFLSSRPGGPQRTGAGREDTRFGFRIAGSTRRSYQIDRESFGTKMARMSLPWRLPRKSRHAWIVRCADIQ
jgi:hypothetical protein